MSYQANDYLGAYWGMAFWSGSEIEQVMGGAIIGKH
jgi:hypothetical protein